MSDTAHTCEHCKYFDTIILFPHNDRSRMYFCRRFPKKVETTVEYWCGEWVQKEQE